MLYFRPSPRTTMDRLSTMSPAARRLATQKMRFSVSPSPRSSSKTILGSTPTLGSPRISTPRKKLSGQSTFTKSQPVLTDNLLKLPNLPQRQKAADFFDD